MNVGGVDVTAVVVPFSEVRFVEIEEQMCEDIKDKTTKAEVLKIKFKDFDAFNLDSLQFNAA